MTVKDLLLKPFEALAGEPYPRGIEISHKIGHLAVDDAEIAEEVMRQQDQWRSHFMHLDGLRTFVNKLRGDI